MRECHQIQERDVQVGLKMAWHSLTVVAPEVTRELAFPFELIRRQARIEGLNGQLQDIPGYSGFLASDDGQSVGKPVASTYEAMTNERYWEVVSNMFGGTSFEVESAGTIFDRSRRFITVKLADVKDFNVDGREFLNRVSLLDSVDGSTNFYAINTSICTVCATTFRMTLGYKSGEFRLKVRHTRNLIEGVENVESTIEGLVGVAAQFKKAMEIAAETPIQSPQARALFAGWLGEGKEELSTRSNNTVSRLVQLFQGGAGNRGETALDAFQAVTDWASHESSGGEGKPGFARKQDLSSEYGAGNRAKQDFFGNLFRFEKGVVQGIATERVSRLQQIGQALLSV